MKAEVDMGDDDPCAELTLTICTIDDAARALDFVKSAARVLFSDIVFSGEPGFDDDPEIDLTKLRAVAQPEAERAQAAPQAPSGGDDGKPLSGFSQRVLEGVRAGKSAVVIAVEQGVKTQAVGAVIGKLRARGII